MSGSRKLSDAAPKVEDLKQLVDYQEQAVVGRMLVKIAGGSVTLFAFDGGVVHRVAEGETLLMHGERAARRESGCASFAGGKSTGTRSRNTVTRGVSVRSSMP